MFIMLAVIELPLADDPPFSTLYKSLFDADMSRLLLLLLVVLTSPF